MAQVPIQYGRTSRSMRKMVEKKLLPAIRKRRPQRILLLSREPWLFDGIEELAGRRFVALQPGRSLRTDTLRCESGKLPFQDASVDVVVMHHVCTDGREAEFGEACRILTSGGELFILGHGSLCMFALKRCRKLKQNPALRAAAMCRQMKARSFEILQCEGSGMLGLPLSCDQGWQQPMMRLSDSILIRGRHRSCKPIVTPLRFSRPQTVGVQSAAADGLNREAV